MCIGIPRDHSLGGAAVVNFNVTKGSPEHISMLKLVEKLIGQGKTYVNSPTIDLKQSAAQVNRFTEMSNRCLEILSENPLDSRAFYQELGKAETLMKSILAQGRSEPTGLPTGLHV